MKEKTGNQSDKADGTVISDEENIEEKLERYWPSVNNIGIKMIVLGF